MYGAKHLVAVSTTLTDWNDGVQLAQAHRWAQYSHMMLAAVRQLYMIRESVLSCSGLSTPWPAASVATSHTTSSPVLRTPQPGESMQPAFLMHTYSHHDAQHEHQYAPPLHALHALQPHHLEAQQQVQQEPLVETSESAACLHALRYEWSALSEMSTERGLERLGAGRGCASLLPMWHEDGGNLGEHKHTLVSECIGSMQADMRGAVDAGMCVASSMSMPIDPTPSSGAADAEACTSKSLLYMADDRECGHDHAERNDSSQLALC